MRKICFTTTSVGRFDIMDVCYASFVKNLEGVDYKKSTLFLNLDHYDKFGDVDNSIKVAKKYFGEVVYNISEKPNFAKAVKWCWSHNFDTRYVFHLEDDWDLVHNVKVETLVSIMESKERMFNVRLRHRGRLLEGKCRWMLLAPSLFKKEFLKIGSMISSDRNPEHSIKSPKEKSRKKMDEYLNVNKCFSYTYTNDEMKKGEKASRSCQDLGDPWKIKNSVSFNGKLHFKCGK